MASKPYAWSFSKMSDLDTCPKFAFHVHVKKDVKNADNYATSRGGKVHKGLETYGKIRAKGMAIEMATKYMKKDLAGAEGGKAVQSYATQKLEKMLALPADEIIFEEKMVVGPRLKPLKSSDWFSGAARGRAGADLSLVFKEMRKTVLVDYKTGKVYKDKLKKQGVILAAMKFITDPDIDIVNFRAHNIDQWDFGYSDTYERDQLESLSEPIKNHLAEMKERAQDGMWEANPSWKCRFCPVIKCKYNES